jgi:ABC-type transport system involved in cytochrome c biogenesis permease subunit
MNKIWQQIKSHAMASYTAIFCVIYLAAWVLNGWQGMHFSCSDLMILYIGVIAKELGLHAINSVCNSPKGEMPQK